MLGSGRLAYQAKNLPRLKRIRDGLYKYEPEWFGGYYLDALMSYLKKLPHEAVRLLRQSETFVDGASNRYIQVAKIRGLYETAQYGKIRNIIQILFEEDKSLHDLKHNYHSFLFAAESFCESGNFKACLWLLYVSDIMMDNKEKPKEFYSAVKKYEAWSQKKYTRSFSLEDVGMNFFHD